MSIVTLSKDLQEWDVKKITTLMKAAVILSNDDVQHILHEVTTSSKVDKLLDILGRKPKEAYYGFVGALYSCKRKDLHDIVRQNQRKVLTGMNVTIDFFLMRSDRRSCDIRSTNLRSTETL